MCSQRRAERILIVAVVHVCVKMQKQVVAIPKMRNSAGVPQAQFVDEVGDVSVIKKRHARRQVPTVQIMQNNEEVPQMTHSTGKAP